MTMSAEGIYICLTLPILMSILSFSHNDIDNIDRFGNIIEDIGDINDDDKELRKATGGRSQYLLTVADTKY